jgi:hypothetical protein
LSVIAALISDGWVKAWGAVADLLAGGPDLLGEQPEVIAVGVHLLEGQHGVVEPAGRARASTYRNVQSENVRSSPWHVRLTRPGWLRCAGSGHKCVGDMPRAAADGLPRDLDALRIPLKEAS